MAVDRLPPNLRLALPDAAQSYEQDAEWCVVDDGSGWRELRFHDYHEIYTVPGLYEKLFYEVLQCQSPPVVTDLLVEQMATERLDPAGVRVLDVGAGNGIVAEELRTRGVTKVVGVDIIPEAAMAAERDRPGVYDDYRVVDLTTLDVDAAAEIAGGGFDALTVVAALGFGDIPPEAFRVAFDMVRVDGFVAFTIRDNFLSETDTSGFAGLIRSMMESGELEELGAVTYQHRLATTRQPVHYRAIVARKRRPRD
ncbi:class I SAM-dependent DNA methyltransferase [Pseudonocardia endophytica]|uniref:Methyltransferase family protein n=1 Tax=Pseudonocardia endophytica TaxID=401976 RepID=A0A4R1HP10_PSEEN|nr:class I SAM-dependent methyltransferase [Pseudonocardia endophytica]TCK22941.1 methyltransferase family protein [Pseudonocardia endophytica]